MVQLQMVTGFPGFKSQQKGKCPAKHTTVLCQLRFFFVKKKKKSKIVSLQSLHHEQKFTCSRMLYKFIHISLFKSLLFGHI